MDHRSPYGNLPGPPHVPAPDSANDWRQLLSDVAFIKAFSLETRNVGLKNPPSCPPEDVRQFFPLTTETEFNVLEAKLGESMSVGAFFNECQTFLLSGILAGKTAFNAIAEKIFNPELACHLSKKGSHGRKIQLDGTMVLELLYNTTAKRDPTCGNEATSLDSWLRHTYERFEAWPNKPKEFPRIQVLSEARQAKVRAFIKQASERAAQRKKERDEELKCYEDGGDEARAYAMTYGSKRKRKISSGGDSTDSGDDTQQKRKPENEENETQQTQLAQSAESAVGDPGNQTVLEVSTSSANTSSTSKEDDHMLDEPNAVFDDLFSTCA
mgnify:CR=1 FL=1